MLIVGVDVWIVLAVLLVIVLCSAWFVFAARG